MTGVCKSIISYIAVYQSWRDIMDSIDQIAKSIKQQADSIESNVVDQLSALYSERRRARKFYQEEQTWLNNQFQQVSKIYLVTQWNANDIRCN